MTLETDMRAREWFHSLTVPVGMWIVVRVDGRGFTKLANERFNRPFDRLFHQCMINTARSLLEDTHGYYAFVESDEISILLPPAWSMWDREVEKIVSTTAGRASAEFSLTIGLAASFDSRIWVGATVDDVVSYFRWRARDAERCGLNSHAYWLLVKAGATARAATKQLDGMRKAEKHELLFQAGINFADPDQVPRWQVNGTGVHYERYVKLGHNPLTGEDIPTERRRLTSRLDLPTGQEYDELILALAENGEVPAVSGVEEQQR